MLNSQEGHKLFLAASDVSIHTLQFRASGQRDFSTVQKYTVRIFTVFIDSRSVGIFAIFA